MRRTGVSCENSKITKIFLIAFRGYDMRTTQGPSLYSLSKMHLMQIKSNHCKNF